MKNFKLGILLIFFVPGAFAQQNYFIYLQSENKQPFYVKLDKQVLSSSVTGYLIIPKLADGDYNLGVVFPRSGVPEQEIVCRVDKKDAGYLIKNFGDNGLGFANIQTQEVIMGGKSLVQSAGPPKEIMDDPFSNMLAWVVNDPRIKEKDEPDVNDVAVKAPEVKEQEVKEQEVKEPEVPPSGRNDEKGQVIRIEDSSALYKAVELSVVKRTYRKKTSDGIEMVYVDVYGDKRDTIRIFMPVENPEEKKPVEIKKDTTAATRPVVLTGMINSDCKNFAVEDDVARLKKKISAETDVDEMIRLAKRTFKTKCFSTAQVRDLGTIFLRDEGRYQFFDAAYPWVSDTDNFPSLQNQLTEEYYINRFKAMIHK